MDIIIRTAEERDVPDIVRLTRELAEYEKLSELCVIDEKMFRALIFEERSLNVLVAQKDGITVGIASYYFYKISTFSGRRVLYLEDLYIVPEARKLGIGRKIFVELKKIAKEKNCGKIEWKCLDWNEPSLNFYDRIGSHRDNDWVTFYISDNEF